MKTKIVRVEISPGQVATLLEQAKAELDRGQPAAARVYVENALTRLGAERAAQNAVLDKVTATPEVREPPS